MTLIIRSAQMRALAAHQHSRNIAGLCWRLREAWPDELAALSESALHRRVAVARKRCALRGLHDERGELAFLELAIRYGWEFEDNPELAWMVTILDDTRVTSPLSRVRRILDMLERQEQTREHNALALASFMLRRRAGPSCW